MEYKDTIVKSVKEYLDWLENSTFSETKSDTGGLICFQHSTLYYRGQSSCIPLNPGVFRSPYSPGLVEHEILQKALLRLWKDLSLYTTYLEKLIWLQHYGMPTRLLDVTFNPLVALYFACSIQNGSNGVVYCGFQQNESNEQIAELTSKYIFTQSFNDVEEDVKSFVNDKKQQMHQFSQPLFVLPPINNPRIEHQNGAFVMAPLLKVGEKSVSLNSDSLDDSGFFSEKRALIPNDCKQDMIKSLHKLGVHKGNIYPGVSEKIGTIVQEEQWKIERLTIDTKEL